MANQKIAAPMSAQFARTQKLTRIKALRGKGSNRSAAETRELLDTLVALLPDDVKSQV